MSNALQLAGAQPNKQTRFSAIYIGRIFTGIWTNRSPLRDAASTFVQEKYFGPRGDAAIAGSNIEVSNRLTLIRRPGNPIYDSVNSYSNVLAYDEFRINKGLSDAFGSVTEQIDVMTDQADQLYASNGTARQSVFTKSVGAGQSNMKQVGNSLYFGNGIDNKKWLQSLFVRNSGNNLTAININSYPFMSTFLIDPNQNIQQMVGTRIATISNIVLASGVLTLTVSNLGANQAVGTQFVIWGLSTATWLNGATLTLTTAYTSGGTTLVGTWTGVHANTSVADTGSLQINVGGSPVTGASVPVWGTTVPSSANNFMGSVTVDGNVIWINRGATTENWGLVAPTGALTPTSSGSAVSWQSKTYYSPASVYIDNVNKYLWQITTPGITGTVQPTWPGAPTPSNVVDITNVSISANVVTFTTLTQSPALAIGNVVKISNLAVATFLNGQSLTVLASGLTTTQFKANFTNADYTSAPDQGIATLPGTTQSDGAAVWTCIQSPASLTWAAHTHYPVGHYISQKVGSTPYLFQLQKAAQPFISGAIVANAQATSSKGGFDLWNGVGGTVLAPTSLSWAGGNGYGVSATNIQFLGVNGAGELTGAQTDSGFSTGWEAAIVCKIFIPAPGGYGFTLQHDDGGFFAFDSSTGAYRVSGTLTDPFGHTATAKNGYTSITGTNTSGFNTDASVWFFPTAGVYNLEIDWMNWEHAGTMQFISSGVVIATSPDETSASAPIWPAFNISGTGTSWNSTTNQIVWGAKVTDAGKQYIWNNLGPQSDYIWSATTNFTLPATQIVDSNGNQQGPYETGISGASAPTFSTSLNAVTADNPNLRWLNEGPVAAQTATTGKITATSAQGWLYSIALVNTLDDTVSNIGPITSSGPGLNGGTGPVVSGTITFAAGSGLNTATIDPQADYVAIFRTTDGLSTQLLIPSLGNAQYTVPLTQYLQSGYVDTTPDTALDTLAEAAASGENTPPLPGAVSLTYHLNRLWYSIGNTVYWTTGPSAPVGNGVNGTSPLNFDVMPSLVKRLVPTAIGVLVFTVSDIYIIPNSGGTILPGLPYAQGIGISSYNALDINGSIIGFFTTDNQFVIFNPSGSLDYVGMPIGDQFRQNNGKPGTSWSAANVYVAWYVNGEDQAWFVADGANGWYKFMQTPSPENSPCWSPFATITTGVKAIKSVETAPGVHALLAGPTGTGHTLQRSITATTDNGTTDNNGTTYAAYIVLGSYVLAHPGQVAEVSFITTDSVNIGSPATVGVILDEALPYYKGSFDILKDWVSDPTGLPKSSSILGQRFYLSDLDDTAAVCRHMQVLVQWPAEAALNEMQAFTIFGAYLQEA